MTSRRRARLSLHALEARDVPSSNQILAIAEDTGPGRVSVFESTGPYVSPPGAPLFQNDLVVNGELVVAGGGRLLARFDPYPGFGGGARVATGDVNSDGVADVIVVPGKDGGPHVKIYDGAGLLTGQVNLVHEFFAFDAGFRGGLFVATGQFLDTINEELAISAGEGGGAHVRVFHLSVVAGPIFSGDPIVPQPPTTLSYRAELQNEFFAFDAGFRGGVRVATADVNGDGRSDLIAAAGPGGGPHVRVFDVFPPDPVALRLSSHRLLDEWFAYDSAFRGGVYVAAGELDSLINSPEIITGAGEGGGPHVRVFNKGGNGKMTLKAEAFAGPGSQTFGVRVGVSNLAQLSNRQSVYVGAGSGPVYPAVETPYDPRLTVFSFFGGVLTATPVFVPSGGSIGVFVGV